MPSLRKKAVSRFDLEKDLRAAGVEEGDVLVVHSALSKVGWLLGGPQEALRALRHVLGPSGTLVMPTFTFNLNGWNLPAFDPSRTPSRVGLLTDTFWREPGVLRTKHPTHSVAAWGRLARELTQGPLDYEPLGIGSPLDRARHAGAKVLLAGVGHTRNSTIHVAESIAGMPYLSVPFMEDAEFDTALYHDGGKEPRLLRIYEMPGSSEGFDAVSEPLHNMGICGTVRFGQATSLIMRSQRLCEAVVEMLQANPTLFLQAKDPSGITLRRRRYMEDLRHPSKRLAPGDPVRASSPF